MRLCQSSANTRLGYFNGSMQNVLWFSHVSCGLENCILIHFLKFCIAI